MRMTIDRNLSTASYGLTNGGTGGVIWVTVGVILGALCMTASIGEWLQWPRLLEVNVSNRLFLTLPFNGAEFIPGFFNVAAVAV